MNKMMERNILTIKEVAKHLKLSERSIYKLAREGKIRGTKIRNKWRFDKRDVDRIFKSGIDKSPL